MTGPGRTALRAAGRRLGRRGAAATALTATAVALAVSALAGAQPSRTVTVPDRRADARTSLDLQRASLRLDSQRRLRLSVTTAAPFTDASLRADDGPPGSVCLRLWTGADPDPSAEAPNRLVCATATPRGRLRGRVYEQEDGALPRRTGTARLQRPSPRSLIVVVTQSAIGRPERVRFAVETTRPGCARTSCIDTAPDAPITRAFRLR